VLYQARSAFSELGPRFRAVIQFTSIRLVVDEE
jgi:hypothetical protein